MKLFFEGDPVRLATAIVMVGSFLYWLFRRGKTPTPPSGRENHDDMNDDDERYPTMRRLEAADTRRVGLSIEFDPTSGKVNPAPASD